MRERLLNLIRPEVVLALLVSGGAAGTIGDHRGKQEIVNFEKVMEYNYRYHMEAVSGLQEQLDRCERGQRE